MSDYDYFAYLVFAGMAIYLGIVELHRIWLYTKLGKITYHRINLKEVELIRQDFGENEAQKFSEEMDKNWWKYQGKESLTFGLTSTLGGLAMVVYILINMD